MTNRIDTFGERHVGCEAKLEDDGRRQQVPVCMGGTALIGCNNPDKCTKLYGERIVDPYSVHVIFRTEDETKVRGITTVPRKPIISQETIKHFT